MRPEFSGHIFLNIQISNFMKFHPQGAELLRVNGQMGTDRRTDGQT